MKKVLACIFFIQITFLPNLLAQDSIGNRLTLKQAVETALSNNLQVKQSTLQVQTAAVNLKQAKANLLPDFFANLNHGLNQGRSIDPFTNGYINQQVTYGSYNINSSVALFNGFQLKNLVKQNALDVEAGKMDLQQAKDNIMLNIILAYLNISNNEEQLVQSQNQAGVTRRQLERLDVMNQAGAVTPTVFYDLKGQLANDDLAIINSRNALNTAKLSLSQLMNVPYNKNLEVEKINIEDVAPDYAGRDAQSIFESAVKQLALIKAADLRQRSAAKSIQVARAGFYPAVALSGNVNTNYSNAARKDIPLQIVDVASGDYVNVNGNRLPVMTKQTVFDNLKIPYLDQFNNNYSTSLYMSIQVPIFNNYRTRNKVALAKIEQQNAAYSAQTIKTQLSQNIEQAWFSMTAAAERYKTLLQQVSDFSESFRTAEVRFNAGVLTQVDYLIAKNNVDRAKINLISARYDYLFRIKILDYYRGSLVL